MKEGGTHIKQCFWLFFLWLSQLFVLDAVYFKGQLGKLEEVLFPTPGLAV